MEVIDRSYFEGMYLDSYPEFSREPVMLIDYVDDSADYETDESYLILLENGTYAVVKLYGCSCYTDQDTYEHPDMETVLKNASDTYGAGKMLYDKARERGFRYR